MVKKMVHYLFILVFVLATFPAFGTEPQVQIENLPAPAATGIISGFVITSPQGIKCFIDTAAIPDNLKKELANPKYLMAVSHKHRDHFNRIIYNEFQGQKILTEAKVIQSGDVTIKTVKASDSWTEPDGSTFIIIIDVAGFRIVHFGDCIQESLTPEQKSQIGHVDVAIAQFEDNIVGADFSNKICFILIDEVNPTLIIPTHIYSRPAIKSLNKKWPAVIAKSDTLQLSKSLLQKGKCSIFMTSNTSIAKEAGVPLSQDL
jgi:L-ascorbate metabolism protein UlaG (beta-lactamase superfamily)